MSGDRKKRGYGLKIDNSQSSIKTTLENDPKSFDQKATEVYNKIQAYKERVWDLSGKFKAIIEDQTLSINKTSITKDLEKEIIDKLVALASEMEADETQPIGLGPIALSVLIMKMLIIQRDKINDLSFQLSKIEKASDSKR